MNARKSISNFPVPSSFDTKIGNKIGEGRALEEHGCKQLKKIEVASWVAQHFTTSEARAWVKELLSLRMWNLRGIWSWNSHSDIRIHSYLEDSRLLIVRWPFSKISDKSFPTIHVTWRAIFYKQKLDCLSSNG